MAAPRLAHLTADAVNWAPWFDLTQQLLLSKLRETVLDFVVSSCVNAALFLCCVSLEQECSRPSNILMSVG